MARPLNFLKSFLAERSVWKITRPPSILPPYQEFPILYILCAHRTQSQRKSLEVNMKSIGFLKLLSSTWSLSIRRFCVLSTSAPVFQGQGELGLTKGDVVLVLLDPQARTARHRTCAVPRIDHTEACTSPTPDWHIYLHWGGFGGSM